jgi:Ca-activated chloride channel family protein
MKKIDLTVRTDRKLAWYRGGSVRYLVADIAARELETAADPERRPLNLALVIDRSGSMGGRPIEAARQAAAGVAETLGPEDLLTLVCFNNNVQTVLRARPMDRAGRADAQAAIAAIHVGGTTDLEAGWLRGAECVAENMEATAGYRNHVVLLSDGMANRGETDPGVLGKYARGLQERGIVSTTVGIGDGYSPEILQAIAENGGGRMHDAEHPSEIVEVVTAELGELSRIVADNVRLRLRLPRGVHCKLLSFHELSLDEPGRVSCLVGNLVAGAARQMVFQITLPGGDKGSELPVECILEWSEDEERHHCADSAVFTLAKGKKNNTQARDEACSLVVAVNWQSRLIRLITRRNVRADYNRLQELEQGEFRYYKKFCRSLPGGEEMIEQVARLLRRARRPIQERQRKEMTLAAYKVQASEPDYRAASRPAWDTFLDD